MSVSAFFRIARTPPAFADLPECDREFLLRLLEAYDYCGHRLIGDSELVRSILWLFPEVRHSPRRTEYIIGYRHLGLIGEQWEPSLSRIEVMRKIEDKIGRSKMLDLGYVPEYRRQRLVFED